MLLFYFSQRIRNIFFQEYRRRRKEIADISFNYRQ